MPNFISGLPAQGSPLQSIDVRENFIALNARTGKIAARATVPTSTSITVDPGRIFFNNRVSIDYEGEKLNLGDSVEGVSSFTNLGFFKDIAIVLRLSFDEDSNTYSASAVFLEGPEKSSATSDPTLIAMRANDIPVARFVVRNNGFALAIGDIEAISQEDILDFRNYLDAGGLSYYSATVGDYQPTIDGYGLITTDAYGDPVITGETIGTFVANEISSGTYLNPIQQAVESLGDKGGTILLKRGTYVLTSPVPVLEGNIRIIGEGSGTVIELDPTFTGPAFSISNDRVSVENLKIQGDGTGSQTGINLNNNQYCTIKDCEMDGLGTGLDLVGLSTRNIITNNYFTNNFTAINMGSGDYNTVSVNQFINNTNDTFNISANDVKVGNVSS